MKILIPTIKPVLLTLTCAILVSFTISPAIQGRNATDPEIQNCDSIPALNKQLISFVNSKLKTKVGTGQCWDLAQQALNTTDAKWNGQYVFGKEVNYKTDCIYPGDIMQFENVLVEYEKDGGQWQETMGHHTAFIYEVKGKGDFLLAHQNFGPQGKKVGLTTLNLANIKKGEFKIYRPVN